MSKAHTAATLPASEPTKLPRIKSDECDAIEDYLTVTYGCKRPPAKAAMILALIVELHRTHTPFPTRAVVAGYVGASPFGVDAAINQARTRGLIDKEVQLVPGNIKVRENVVQVSYYVPTKKLLTVLNRANRKVA